MKILSFALIFAGLAMAQQPMSISFKAEVPPLRRMSKPSLFPSTLQGEVARMFPDDSALMLYHEEIAGFMDAMEPPCAIEFLVPDKALLSALRPGMKIEAGSASVDGTIFSSPS